MTKSQGSFVKKPITFPTGFVEESADDLHTATYVAGSKDASPVTAARFTDDYTNVQTVNKTYSKVGFSFILGILSSLLAYLIGIPRRHLHGTQKRQAGRQDRHDLYRFQSRRSLPCVHLHG